MNLTRWPFCSDQCILVLRNFFFPATLLYQSFRWKKEGPTSPFILSCAWTRVFNFFKKIHKKVISCLELGLLLKNWDNKIFYRILWLKFIQNLTFKRITGENDNISIFPIFFFSKKISLVNLLNVKFCINFICKIR